jgi:predicted nucleic acid-binding protein
MAKKTESYVDTSALIAFIDRSDTHHSLFQRLFSDPPPPVTTPLVVAEGHAWVLRRYDRTRALQFMAMIEDMKPVEVVPVGATEQAGAVTLMRRYADQDLTLADALGLHLMRTCKIKQCWSTDIHLGLTGFALVING